MNSGNVPNLFKNKIDCCGCGACENVCPKNAISMLEDEDGFLYPRIDDTACIRCKKCTKVCAFQNIDELHTPINAYAAISKNRKQASESASGGIFSAIAERIIKENGIVFGATFTKDYGVEHRYIDELDELLYLQGSKYVHSRIGDSYKKVKIFLEEGKPVLFSGTPCQVAGLYAYLGKEYENLFTIDIICHGVPSEKMFRSYIQYLEEKYNGILTFFTFRDKKLGWGINGRMTVKTQNKKEKNITLWQSGSSYLFYFIKGWIYRENCYHCKYACKNRPGDITIGDFWGIERQHPDYIGKNGWDESNGISSVIVNTDKGKTLLNKCENVLELKNSTFDDIAIGNAQLNKPCTEPGGRKNLLLLYKLKGWAGLEKYYSDFIGLRKYESLIKSLIPNSMKRWIKRNL